MFIVIIIKIYEQKNLGEYVCSLKIVDNKCESKLICQLKERHIWQGYGSERDRGWSVPVFNQPL